MQSKILVLVGPTSSGKSEMAVNLAKRFNGEIISCDSRQIYRGMDLGTGKIEGKWHTSKNNGRYFYKYKNIIHHCIDYVSPRRQYSVDLFKQDAQKAIRDILSRGKLPILCGGTMHWVDAVVYDQQLPNVPPNPKLRSRLEKMSADDLYLKLKKLDPHRAASIDPRNPRRLIRALEIIAATGKAVPRLYLNNSLRLHGEAIVQSKDLGSPPPILTGGRTLNPSFYNALWLGITSHQPTLYKKIDQRLKARLKAGLIKEVQHLHYGPTLPLPRGSTGVSRGGVISWKRLSDFGLEYRFVSLYLQKKLTYDEMFQQLSYAIKHYSKRQLTWWKRNKDIYWIEKYGDAKNMVRTWLAKKQ